MTGGASAALPLALTVLGGLQLLVAFACLAVPATPRLAVVSE